MSIESRLRRARGRAEKALLDRCQVLRDAEGRDDDVFDEETGLYERPVGDERTVYSGAFALVSGSDADSGDDGAAIDDPSTFAGLFPAATPPLLRGDRVRVLSSELNPEIVDREFVVSPAQQSSYLVLRRVPLEARP